MLFQSGRIHTLFQTPFSTSLFLLFTSSKKCGAKFLGASPSSQLCYPNRAFFPFPTETKVDALKRSWSPSLQGTSVPTQGLELSTHSCQSHRCRRALPNMSRFVTPSPTRSFGLLTVGQLTRQWPLFAFSSPFQRQDLIILSIFAQTARGNTVSDKLASRKAPKLQGLGELLDWLSILPFHLGNLCPIRSMRGYTWIFWSDRVWSCKPS